MVLFPESTRVSSFVVTFNVTVRNRHSPLTVFVRTVASQVSSDPTGTRFILEVSCPTWRVPPGIFRSSITPLKLRAAIAIGGAIVWPLLFDSKAL